MVGMKMPLEEICLENSEQPLVVGDRPLTINEVVSVARRGVQVRITDAHNILDCVQASCDYIQIVEVKVGKLEISSDWNRSFDISVPTIFLPIFVQPELDSLCNIRLFRLDKGGGEDASYF